MLSFTPLLTVALQIFGFITTFVPYILLQEKGTLVRRVLFAFGYFLAANSLIGSIFLITGWYFALWKLVLFHAGIYIIGIKLLESRISFRLKPVIDKTDTLVIMILILSLGTFVSGWMILEYGKRLPVFTLGVDSAQHFHMVHEVIRQGIFDRQWHYPIGFFFNGYLFHEALIRPFTSVLPLADYIHLKISLYSFYSILILLVVLGVGSYLMLTFAKTMHKGSIIFNLILVPLIFYLFFGEVLMRVFYHGHFTQLMSYLFLSLILYQFKQRERSNLLIALTFYGFIGTYYYMLPALIPLGMWTLFVNRKNFRLLMIYAFLGFIMLFAFIIPILQNQRVASGLVFFPGGVDELPLVNIALWLFGAILFIIIRRKDRCIPYIASISSSIAFSIFLFLYLSTSLGEMRYSYYKSLHFIVFFASLTSIPLLYSVIEYVISRTGKMAFPVTIGFICLLFISLYSFGDRKVHSLSQGYIAFFPAHVYNSLINFIDEQSGSEQKSVLVTDSIGVRWAKEIVPHYLWIKDYSTYPKDFFEEVKKISQSEHIFVLDPLRAIQFSCKKEYFDLQEQGKITLYPPASAFWDGDICEKKTENGL